MFQMSGPSQIMLNDEEILVRRQSLELGNATIVVGGKRVKRGFEDFRVLCNIQPVSGDDLIMVPEGDRFDEQLWAYVADPEKPLQPNDLISRKDDGWYQVQMCEGWGSYTRARLQRVDVGTMQNTQLTDPDPEALGLPLPYSPPRLLS